MGTFLIILGLACVIGAVVGGGIRIATVHIDSIGSIKRQLLLAVIGAGLIYAGMVSGSGMPFGGTTHVDQDVSAERAAEAAGQ